MQSNQQGGAKPRAGRPRTGHVYWHRDHWDIRIRDADGKRGKPQHLDPSISEAHARKLAAQASVLALKQGATPAPAPAPTLTPALTPTPAPSLTSDETANAWLERWIADRRLRGISTAEQAALAWHKWIAPVFGTLPMRSVTRDDIELVVERLDEAVRADDIRAKTAMNIWIIVKAAFRDARDAKNRSLRVRSDNPTDGVRPPDGGVIRSKPWIYPCEMSALLACPRVPVRWRRLFALAAYLYLRRSELAALTIDDVDLIGGVVLIHRTACRSGSRAAARSDDATKPTTTTKPTKTKITHRVPIEPTLRPLLIALIAEARAANHTHLIKLPPVQNLGVPLRKYLPWAGVTRPELFADDETRAPLTFHDLRATGITWRAVRGDDPLKIQRAVGHRSLTTTQRYIREAEVIGRDIGEPFPPIPAALLATGLANLAAPSPRSPSNQADPADPATGCNTPCNGATPATPTFPAVFRASRVARPLLYRLLEGATRSAATTHRTRGTPMNAARFALSVSLCCAAALLGCATDPDESEHSAPALAQQAQPANGYGYEFIAAKVTPGAPVSAPIPAEVAGRLAPELIADVVRSGFGTLAACNPGAPGAEISVHFKINEAGVPNDVSASSAANPALAACVQSAASALRFPKSHGGKAEVIYPLTF
jgi:integrase